MKKIVYSVLAFTMLAGCNWIWYPLDHREEAAENRAIQKAIEGCSMLDDHAAYRECMIQTKLKTAPKTYVTYDTDEGSAVAVTRCKPDPKTNKNPCAAPVKEEKKPEPKPEPKKVECPCTTVTTTACGCNATPACGCAQPQHLVPVTETTVIEEFEEPEEVIVVEPVPTPQPQERTWWETYQENRPVPAKPSCDCDDPNVTCPECYEK